MGPLAADMGLISFSQSMRMTSRLPEGCEMAALAAAAAPNGKCLGFPCWTHSTRKEVSENLMVSYKREQWRWSL